jgi:KUP system potassium uptake protein
MAAASIPEGTVTAAARDRGPHEPALRGRGTAALVLGALGVVFGDIGTSPLYALHAVFAGDHRAVQPVRADVYGVVSLVFWTITLVVTVKYVTFIMRADNGGEGGIMALVALARRVPARARVHAAVMTLGVFGAALFYGDGMITPAISVLSAVEGLDVAAPGMRALVVPIALVVLVALFAIQRCGTGAIGALFGPIMALWFGALALAGLREVVERPAILEAVSPSYAIAFFAGHLDTAFVATGSVLLTVTGAEALYADMGHFGRSPIRRAWLLVVFPALFLDYAGQGALILDSPAAVANPFFLLLPHWARLPMVVFATAATVIASQAVISGAFSVTHQAMQLGWLPRLTVRHTSARERGQVYVPAVNWLLCCAVAVLVVGFGSSAKLAAAYGLAVAGTMATTTIVFVFLTRFGWRAPLWVVVPGAAILLAVDVTLLSASLTKLAHGGWLPLSIAAAVFVVMTTWRKGREMVGRAVLVAEGPLRRFVQEIRSLDPPILRPPRTAVFVHANPETTPLALRAEVEHNHSIHRTVVIVVIRTLDAPHVDAADRVTVDDLGYRDDGITHVTARFGFRDVHDVPAALRLASARDLEGTVDPKRASYFLSRISLVRGNAPGMRPWRRQLFLALSRNQAEQSEYYAVPEERTVTMGSLIAV